MKETTLIYKDLLADTKEEKPLYQNLSLVKLAGKKIKDIEVSISTEFDGPAIQIRKIIFDDDRFASVNGEHDIAYLEDDIQDVSETVLTALERAENIYDGYEKGENVIEIDYDETEKVHVIVSKNPWARG